MSVFSGAGLAGWGGSACRNRLPGSLEDAHEDLRCLGAGDCVAAVEDEAGNPGNAYLSRLEVFEPDGVEAALGFELGPRHLAVETGFDGDLDQAICIADVDAVFEIAAEQQLDETVLAALLAGRADQTVSVDGVRRPFDAVEGERNALLGTDLEYLIIDIPGMCRRAEFGDEIDTSVHTFGWHIRVELKRPPRNLDVEIRSRGERALKPALADEAPRANDVGDDVNKHMATLI